MTVSVSVILPTHNRSDSLKAACESVLHQSYRDLELIIVDDASSEDLQEVVSALNDERVRYIRRDRNGGASRARNTGLAAAKGRFIAFQDSDDLWLPGKLERQVALFDTLPEDVGVVTGSKILYGRDAGHNYGPGKVVCAPEATWALRLDEDQVRRMLRRNRIGLQMGLFRRGCLPYLDWFDPCAKANNDWEFAVRFAQHSRIYEDTQPVVLAFISGDSISTNTRKKILGLIRILKKNRQVLETYPDIHANHLLLLAKLLMRTGRHRLAIKLSLAALRRHPPASTAILGIGWRRLIRLFGRTPKAPSMPEA